MKPHTCSVRSYHKHHNSSMVVEVSLSLRSRHAILCGLSPDTSAFAVNTYFVRCDVSHVTMNNIITLSRNLWK